MSHLANIRRQSRWQDLFEGQLQHGAMAILLSAGAVSLLTTAASPAPMLGLSTVGWAQLSITLALIHQIIVAIVFRLQLHRNFMTQAFRDRDMLVWRLVFMPLLLARPITVLMTGLADDTGLTGVRSVEVLLGILLTGLAIWALHSVLVYFTLPRALGGDHFRDEIARLPLVTRGVFRYTSNGMYGVAFLGLWGIAFLCGSWNALILALFQHAYIWVHMYCTETPDMRWIYGNR